MPCFEKCPPCDECQKLHARLEQAVKAALASERALKKYGLHLNDCPAWRGQPHWPCVCGLDEALATTSRDANEVR